MRIILSSVAIGLALMSLIISSSASMYQGHPVPDGWNVTFHNETTIEMTDGNSTMGLYNVTIPKEVNDFMGSDGGQPGMDVDIISILAEKFIRDREIELPDCRGFTTNQAIHPFRVDTLRMTFCDNGDYLFVWRTPGQENDFTCLYAKFRGDFNRTSLSLNQDELMPSVLYEYLC